MAEWQNYNETSFTDFGSVGETRPVDDIDMDNFERTRPDITDNEETGRTLPDGPVVNPWSDDPTQPVTPGIIDEDGDIIRPATGWLVCIEGKSKGTDYRLYDGYTYIGRGTQNQVIIPDPKVSSAPSARILYDNESRHFYINECDGAKNPVYLNDKLFDHRVELAPYDVIKLGGTKLLFVPLCTAKFAWEE